MACFRMVLLSSFVFLLSFSDLYAEKQEALSKSLVECSVIFHLNGKMAESQGSDVLDVQASLEGARRFRKEAEMQAIDEGKSDPDSYLNALYDKLIPKWDARYKKITHTKSVMGIFTSAQAIMDKVHFCGALGVERGILPVD